MIDTVFVDDSAQYYGGGAVFESTSAVTNTIFSANKGGYGGGAAFMKQNVVSHTQFISNSGSNGAGGAWFAGGAQVNTSTFIGNRAPQGGGAILGLYDSNLYRMQNVLFADNGANSGDGAAIYYLASSHLNLTHATIASVTPISGSAIYINNAQANISDTLIASHTLGVNNALGAINAHYTLFSGVDKPYSSSILLESHTLFGTAQFVDPAKGDYHLQSGSLGINAGVAAGVTVDYDGDSRPQGGGYDIGFDETADQVSMQVNNSGPVGLGTPVYLTATLSNGAGFTFTWDLGDGTNATGATINHTYVMVGTYTVIVTASNALGSTSATTQVLVNVIEMATPTPTATAQPAETATVTPTGSEMPTSTSTPPDTSTATLTPTDGAMPTGTPTPTGTATPTGTPAATTMPSDTTTPTPMPTDIPTNTPTAMPSTPPASRQRQVFIALLFR